MYHNYKNNIEKTVFTFFSISVLLNLFVIFLIPSIGIDVNNNLPKGIYLHKNWLGSFSLLSTGYYLSNFLKGDKKYWSTFYLILSFYLISVSSSKTSLVLFLIVFLMSMLTKYLKAQNTKIIIGYLFILMGFSTVIIYLIFMNIKSIFLFLGRDLTLTGRTELWTILWNYTQDKRFIGYGLSGFWGENSENTIYVRNFIGWDVFGSHNGYMELYLYTGLLGVSIAVILVMQLFKKSLSEDKMKARKYYGFIFLMIFSLINLFENRLMISNGYYGIFWIFFIFIALQINLKVRN